MLCLGDFQQAEKFGREQCADGEELPFLFGFVAINYLKFKLGYLAEKEVDTALIKGIQMNQFVPEYLLMLHKKSSLPEMEDPNSYIVSQKSEALNYVHSAKDVWEKLPGLLDWVECTNQRGNSPVPQDGGKILFDLLSKGRVLVDVVESRKRNREDGDEHPLVVTKKLTSHYDDMTGQALPGFRVPPSVKEFTPSTTITCFWDDDDKNNRCDPATFFTSFRYSDVRKVHFWKLLHGSGYYNHEMELQRKKYTVQPLPF